MQGWCKFYEFSDADLRSGLEVLTECLSDSSSRGLKWDFIHGLFSNAIFGGRIDDPQDAKVLMSYLKDYFNSRVISERPTQKLANHIVLDADAGDTKYYSEIVNRCDHSQSDLEKSCTSFDLSAFWEAGSVNRKIWLGYIQGCRLGT